VMANVVKSDKIAVRAMRYWRDARFVRGVYVEDALERLIVGPSFPGGMG
jgi:hypothetical protein